MKNIFKKMSMFMLMVLALLGLVGCDTDKPNDNNDDDSSVDVPSEETYSYVLNHLSISLEEGQTEQLAVTVTPAKEITPEYESSDSNVVTVSDSGLVTAVSAGTATITVKVDDKELTCQVTVTAKHVEIEYEYSLNKTSASIEVESSTTILVFVDPDKEITPEYESSDESIATVSSTGVVTGVSAGTATITVKVDGVELTCQITVTAKPIVYEYVISDESIDMELGDTHQLTVSVTPEKAIVPTFESQDESVAVVSSTGLVTGVGKGTTTITATVDGKVLSCEVSVESKIEVNNVNVEDITDLTINLTDSSDIYSTLYWEHYSGHGDNGMLNAQDLILSNSIAEGTSNFWDYKAKFDWSNGTTCTAWAGDNSGKCYGGITTMEVLVNPNVKEIVVYTGAWRANVAVALYVNGVLVKESNAFEAGESGIARAVRFSLNASEEMVVTIKITPEPTGADGNASCVAVTVLGENSNVPSTSVSATLTEMTGHNNNHINLTKYGSADWFYPNYENQPDEKQGGTAILTESLKVESNGKFWDYKAAFTWTDGTINQNSLIDNDCDNQGTNNGVCGAYVNISVNVTSETKHIYLYVGGWQSTYYIQVIDSKGNTIYLEKMHDATDTTYAYQVDFAVNSAEEDTLTFIVYRTSSGNCSIAAVAVANSDLVYDYTLSDTEVELTEKETKQLSVFVDPEKQLTVEYSSENPNIATVDENGLITAVGAGETVINVSVDGKILTCAVKVNPIIYTYTLSNTELTINAGESQQLSLSVSPAKELNPVYKSNNEAVATVDQNGLITAVGEGETQIVVAVDGEELVCIVIVPKVEIIYQYSLQDELTLVLGSEAKLEVVVTPAKAIEVLWTSSNDDIVSVDEFGNIKGLSAGTATISAFVDDLELICEVVVESPVTVGNVSLIEGSLDNTVNLTNIDSSLDTLYWEHYSGDGVNKMLHAQDLINVINIEQASSFYDYNTVMMWANGSIFDAYDYNRNGRHTNGSVPVFELEFAVDSNVKQIRIYTGAWNKSGAVALYVNGIKVAETDTFVAGGSGIARYAIFDLEVTEATTVVAKVTPGEGDGNCSLVASAILGTNAKEATTNLTMDKVEMTGKEIVVDLSARGDLDWMYFNDGGEPVRKVDGTLIDASVLSGGGFGDYKASFTWNNGTREVWADDNGGNGRCGGAVRIDVNVNSETKHVVLYVGGWQSTYYIEVIDSNGLVLHDELLHEATGTTYAYELDFTVSASEAEKLTFIVYRVGGGNCSMAAVMVQSKATDYQYTLSDTEVSLTVGDTHQLNTTINHYKPFEVIYESSDESIVSVSENGLLSALAAGAVVITSKVDGKELQCNVHVKAAEIQYEYTLNHESLELVLGDSEQLVVSVTPEKEFEVNFSSSDASVATVDANGNVVAHAKGEAVITAKIGTLELTCQVNVLGKGIVDKVSVLDGANQSTDLTDIDENLDTLYWEHYSSDGVDSKMNATDLIISTSNVDNASNFWDYKNIMSFTDSSARTIWLNTAHGKCINAEISMTIALDASVKQIRVYTGAWRATGTVGLYIDDQLVISADSFTAGDNGIARTVIFDVTVLDATEVVIKITPSNVGNDGNVSIVAVGILGESNQEQAEPTTSVTMSKEEMVGHGTNFINLTEKGTADWFYTNYEHQIDEKKDGTAILTDSLVAQSNGKMWDYRAAFSWTDGTINEQSPIDNDCDNHGTNNGVCGDSVSVKVQVTSETQKVILYVCNWQSEYNIAVLDQNGVMIHQELLHENNGGTVAYELTFDINATTDDVLTFVVYKTGGNNCTLAAVAVQ